MILNGADIPVDYEKYATPPEYLKFRTDFTDEELKILKQRHAANMFGSFLVSCIFLAVSGFAGYYLLSLTKNSSDNTTKIILTTFGAVIIAAALINAIRTLFVHSKKDFGVCDNGILIEAFQARYHTAGARNSTHEFCVSAWFPYTGQYCPKLKYGDIKSWKFNDLQSGDNVKVYRINRYEVFALCSPQQPQYPQNYPQNYY